MKQAFLKNPFLLFSPFLLIYIIFLLFFYSTEITGDEGYYIFFAQNLLHGFYSPPAPNIDLNYGPGYPIFLTPFVAINAPFLLIKLMNPIFYYLSVVFLFKSLLQISTTKIAIAASLFWAVYINAFQLFLLMHSEIFVTFLVVVLIFTLIKAFNIEASIQKNTYNYLAGFILGYIALTKVIFGYVLLIMIIGAGILWLIKLNNINYRKILFILIIANVTTLPYLTYTYKLTDRLFYWGTTGGNNLYWMSNPIESEYGMWLPDPIIDSIKNEANTRVYAKGQLGSNDPSIFIPGAEDSLILHHQNDFKEINKYVGIARDDAFKRLAIRNIKEHPKSFLKNCICNIERIFLNYPFGYMLQKPTNVLKFIFNGIILVFMLICIPITLLNWEKIIFQIRFLLFFVFIYLGGSILGSAEIRMFTVVAPIFICWIAYILQNTVKINLKFKENQEN